MALGPVDSTMIHTCGRHCAPALTIDVAMSELVTFHLTPEATLQLGLDYRGICMFEGKFNTDNVCCHTSLLIVQ